MGCGTAETSWHLSGWPRYPESLRYRAMYWAQSYPPCRGYLPWLQYRRYPRYQDFPRTHHCLGCHQPSCLPMHQSRGCPLGLIHLSYQCRQENQLQRPTHHCPPQQNYCSPPEYH